MSDSNPQQTNGTPTEAAAAPQPRLQILAQFIRDLSFENAVAQRGAPTGDVTPEIAVQVSLDARRRGSETQYEVITKFKVNSTNSVDNTPLFICELEYAGIFQIEGIPDDQLHAFLMIECPRLLFPFVRRIISDVTRDGGFPPFNMDLVDFVSLYRQELARRAQAERPTDQQLS